MTSKYTGVRLTRQGWKYEFTHQKKKYSKDGFATAEEARDARETAQHKVTGYVTFEVPDLPEDNRPKHWKMPSRFLSAHRATERVVELVGNENNFIYHGAYGDLAKEAKWMRNAWEMIEARLNGGSIDNGIADLLGEES